MDVEEQLAYQRECHDGFRLRTESDKCIISMSIYRKLFVIVITIFDKKETAASRRRILDFSVWFKLDDILLSRLLLSQCLQQ